MSDDVIRVAQIIGKMNNGGVESVIMNYYRNIDRSKIQFDFFVDEDSTNILKDEILSLGGKIYILPSYKKIFKYVKELISILKINNYKIVHANLNTLNLFPLFCAYIAKVPIRISHSHTTSNKKERKRNLIKNILRLFSRLFVTDYFCCTKQSGEYQFGKKLINLGKVTIINNAIDIDKFIYNSKIRQEVRKELNVRDEILIGHVGRFITQKNHKFLIEVFNQLVCNNNEIKFKLLLVGEGKLEKNIKEMVKRMKIEDKVIFLGPRNDVGRLMQGMDLFLFPSLYEGLGMVLIEAQTASLLSIASIEVPPCVNITGNVYFLPISDPSEWCNKILELLALNNVRKSCKKKIIDSGYDIKKESKLLLDIYLDRINNLYKE